MDKSKVTMIRLQVNIPRGALVVPVACVIHEDNIPGDIRTRIEIDIEELENIVSTVKTQNV